MENSLFKNTVKPTKKPLKPETQQPVEPLVKSINNFSIYFLDFLIMLLNFFYSNSKVRFSDFTNIFFLLPDVDYVSLSFLFDYNFSWILFTLFNLWFICDFSRFWWRSMPFEKMKWTMIKRTKINCCNLVLISLFLLSIIYYYGLIFNHFRFKV